MTDSRFPHPRIAASELEARADERRIDGVPARLAAAHGPLPEP